MKAYEIKLNDDGQTEDHELNALSKGAGFRTVRQMLYELGKWNWEITEIKKRLEKICIRTGYKVGNKEDDDPDGLPA